MRRSVHSSNFVRQLAHLRQRVEQLEAARPRDVQDAAFREQLAVATQGLPFRVGYLFQHALTDATLAAALTNATIQTPDEAGCWLRAHKGTAGGITIERLRKQHWRVYMDYVTYPDDHAATIHP